MAVWKKANLIVLFFLLRKLILPFYSFTLFCVILPLTMFVPEAELPDWVVCYVPALMSLLNVAPAPRSFPFVIPYLLFENTMSVTKFNAMVSGLFQLRGAHEWVVTKKSGRPSSEREQQRQEAVTVTTTATALSLLLLTAAARSLLSKQGMHFYFLLFQGVSFLLVGLDLIGEDVK
jgi:hypothetical protein